MKFEELKIKLHLSADEAQTNWHRHTEGGGWVQNTADIGDEVFVGPKAVVYGTSKITGRVVITDSAIVGGDSSITAHEGGSVLVNGDSAIKGSAAITANNGEKITIRNERVESRNITAQDCRPPAALHSISGCFAEIGRDLTAVR